MPTNNPLNRYPRVRQILLDIQFVTAGAIAVLGAWFAASGQTIPGWYVAVAATLPVLWSYLGFTAARNVTVPADYAPEDEYPDLAD